MQFPQSVERTQLPLFHSAIISAQPITLIGEPAANTWAESVDSFSELSLRGSTENCLLLLSPMLRELSQQAGDRWLTLIDAPTQITQSWLRNAGLKREASLLLKTSGTNSAVELACEALRLGRSHTVISWINPLDTHSRQLLIRAALQGNSQSLNIRLD